ncbi:putative amidase signature domain-containing protein [Septoria linicola]|nr:putative amidase signature domain-containing protein [Septoria linicola]
MHALTKAVLSPVTSVWDDPNGPEREQTATEITAQRLKRDQFRSEFVESWNKQDIDVVLAPCFVGPASKHDTAYYWNYTALWNFVDYPGIVIPTPIRVEEKAPLQEMEKLPIPVQSELVHEYISANTPYKQEWKPLSEKDEHVKEMWDEGGFEGAPINLQIIGRRYHDNELMGIVGKLQGVLGFA